MSKETLKNGLTKLQSDKAREVLIMASIRKVAKQIGTSNTVLYGILSGNNSNIELLDKALREAHKIIEQEEKEKQQLIANLPL